MQNRPNECRLLSVSSILGYGFPEKSLETGLARNPHFIGVDGGDRGNVGLGRRSDQGWQRSQSR